MATGKCRGCVGTAAVGVEDQSCPRRSFPCDAFVLLRSCCEIPLEHQDTIELEWNCVKWSTVVERHRLMTLAELR